VVSNTVGARLVTGTLHRVLCTASTVEGLAAAVAELDRRSPAAWWRDRPGGTVGEPQLGAGVGADACRRDGGACDGGREGDIRNVPAVEPVGSIAGVRQPSTSMGESTRPHVLLMPYGNGGAESRVSAKRRKSFLASFLKGTSLEPRAGTGPKGCGSTTVSMAAAVATVADGLVLDKLPRANHRRGAGRVPDPKPHLVLLVPVGALDRPRGGVVDRDRGGACYLTCLVKVEAAVNRVAMLPPPPVVEGKATPVRPELAWAVSNLAMLQPGHLVLDPYVGTGSLLAPGQAMTAVAVGIDIVPTYAAGMPPFDRIQANARRLPLRGWGGRDDDDGGRLGDAARDGCHCDGDGAAGSVLGRFDAVICDPPYGLRKPRMVHEGAKDAAVLDGAAMQQAVAAAMAPILDFAGGPGGLVQGGRLVFLFPSFDFERAKTAMDRHSVREALPARAGLVLIAVCTQDFKGMARHVVVMERRD